MGVKSQQLQIRVSTGQKAALRRAARRAGMDVSTYVLARVLPLAATRAEKILTALRRGDDHRFALADLNDLLADLAPGQLADVGPALDPVGLVPFLRNYVAAMVEQVASQTGEAPPPWVRTVEPLDVPYFAAPFAGLRPHLLKNAPVAFKRRNLFVDATVGDRV